MSGDRLRWRRHAHLRIGQSEMWPVGSHVKLLAHARAISPKAAHSVIEAFDQIRAMTWRLLNPKP